MFEWLETTKLAVWVGESLWGYPIMLGAHAVGLAIVVGIFLIFDIKALGLLREVPYSVFSGLFRLAWVGLAINALSGSALFVSQATTFVESTPFLVKITSVFVAVVSGVMLQLRLTAHGTAWDRGEINVDKVVIALAVLSLVGWLSAILAGRLIAYL